jgi:hypothetical protein
MLLCEGQPKSLAACLPLAGVRLILGAKALPAWGELSTLFALCEGKPKSPAVCGAKFTVRLISVQVQFSSKIDETLRTEIMARAVEG